LKWVAADGPATFADGPAEAGRHHGTTGRPLRGGPAIWALVAVLAAALAATGTLALRHLRETPLAAQPYSFTIPAPDNAQFGGPAGGGTGAAAQLAVSPDGRHVAFVVRTDSGYRLWIRSANALAPREVSGTDEASFPFWSPDSRFIGFFAGGKLKKVQSSGGPPVALCDAPGGRGGAWNTDNVNRLQRRHHGAAARVRRGRQSVARDPARRRLRRHQSPVSALPARRPPLPVHRDYRRL
jgi:hypothetical protein